MTIRRKEMQSAVHSIENVWADPKNVAIIKSPKENEYPPCVIKLNCAKEEINAVQDSNIAKSATRRFLCTLKS